MTLSILIAGVGVLGYHTYVSGGFDFRLPGYQFHRQVNILLAQGAGRYGNVQNFIDTCDFVFQKESLNSRNILPSKCFKKDTTSSKHILLWGDSYAQMLSYGLIHAMPRDWQLLQVASRGCQPTIYELHGSHRNYCKQTNYFAMKVIAEELPEVVVIAQNSDWSQENVSLFSEKLHQIGVKQVIYVGKPPQWNASLPVLMFRKFPKPIPEKTNVGLNDAAIKNSRLSVGQLRLDPSDAFISLVDLFCESNSCKTFLGESPEEGITSLDDSHLTPVASEYVARQLIIPLILSPKR